MPKSYTIVAISDIHMSNNLPHAAPTRDGMTDRLEEQIRLWEHVKDTAAEQKADAVFILGDLFDKSRVDPVTLTTTVEAVTSLGAPVHLLGGNHDANTIHGGRFAVEAFRAMGRDDVHCFAEGASFQPLDWLYFWPIHFGPAGEVRKRLDDYRAQIDPWRGETNVLLLHQSILGCTHVGWTCDDGLTPEEATEGFQQTLSGHFHDPQQFGPELTGRYLGAPMHHRFDDVGREAGYWVVKYRQGKPPRERFVDPGLPRFHTFDHIEADASRVRRGDFVQFQIRATHSDWVALLPRAVEVCRVLRENGIRATHKHKPIVAAEERLAVAEGATEVADLNVHLEAYQRHVSGAKDAALLTLGKEILAEAMGHAD